MEMPASSFKLRANVPEGRKRFPISRNPLKVKPDDIKDIQVLRTIKRGKQVFAKSP